MEVAFTGERVYSKVYNETDKQHRERYHTALNYIKEGDVILDVACGSGHGAYYMALNTNCSQIVGLDISDEALGWARQYCVSDKITYLQIDLEEEFASKLPLTEFDVITCFETVEHIKNDKAFMQQLSKLLKPGGVLLVSTPNEAVVSHAVQQNPFHYRHYLIEELEQLANECGFTVIDYYTQFNDGLMNGTKGILNTIACTNIPVKPASLTDMDDIIQTCYALKEAQASADPDGNNGIIDVLDIAALSLRFNQILVSYMSLRNAISLLETQQYDECLAILDTVNESICPERYLFEGMAYQGKQDLSVAVEKYALVLSHKDNFKSNLIDYALAQITQMEDDINTIVSQAASSSA